MNVPMDSPAKAAAKAVDGSSSRCAIYFFYDPQGRVDGYVSHALVTLRPYVDHLLVVCNGALDEAGRERLELCCDTLLLRENTGFDVWAYKEALHFLGREKLACWDELLLLNHTFFAPIFPWSELFGHMAARACDFWGISAHREIKGASGCVVLPFHVQSHFIAVRRRMLASQSFWRYWQAMPRINSYEESIHVHEALFTKHFIGQGFTCAVYLDPDAFTSENPVFLEIEQTLAQRCPILKRRPFFHDPLYLEKEAVDLQAVLRCMAEHSSYDQRLIWESISRAAPLRTLYTNTQLLSVLDEGPQPNGPIEPSMRLAVVMHVYYLELLEELMAHALRIPGPFDLVITTDTMEKQAAITATLSDFSRGSVDVRCVGNTGRDMAALLLGCRDVVLQGGYDLICRLHTKRSAQDGPGRGTQFKRHLLENLLGSPAYVQRLLQLFAREPWLGMVMPVTVHIGYPTLGHAWFTNKGRAASLAEKLGITVPLDEHTPLAAYGSMYWFRPAALRRLFEHPWQTQDFDERQYGDGDLPHVIERLLTYCAQQDGYMTRCVMTATQMAKNYVFLEYKYQALASCFATGDVREQIGAMLWGHIPHGGVRHAAAQLKRALWHLAAALRRSTTVRLKHLGRRLWIRRQHGKEMT